MRLSDKEPASINRRREETNLEATAKAVTRLKASTISDRRARVAEPRAARSPAAKTTPSCVAGTETAGMFRQIRLEPAYKAVSAEIERSILEGVLKPGEPLPTEQALAEHFGVHRSTVREAIRQVEQEGLLQRREGRRLFVTLPGLYDMAPRAARLLLLQQTTFHELWQVAVIVEPLAARLAAEHADAMDLQALTANTDMTAELTESGGRTLDENARLVQLDVEFHALVGRASHNPALILAREPISLLYNPTLLRIHMQLPQSKARNLAAHRAILKALQQRDAAAAEDWTRKHMVDFQRGFELAALDMSAPITLNP